MVILALAACVSVSQPMAHRAPSEMVTSDPQELPSRGPTTKTLTDRAIERFEERVNRNPLSAPNYTILGQLYLRRARETGDVANYPRAERALRRALELKPDYPTAQTLLASVLMAQHRFTEALALVEDAYAKNPKDLSAFAIMGDAHLELGHYAEADKLYRELARQDANAPVLVRLAHLEELNGRQDEAQQTMQRAADMAMESGMTAEEKAWYRVRLGHLFLDRGQIDAAAGHCEAALVLAGHSAVAVAGLGEVRAAQGRYDEAIELYQRAVQIQVEPSFLIMLGDLHARTGALKRAQDYYEQAETLAKHSTIHQAYRRELSLLYANHDWKPTEALALAQADLDTRRDIYAYDTLAWALYKNNQPGEAAAAMIEAMKLGTQDARLYYHAGAIYSRLGQPETARRYLEQALRINASFSVLHADDARRLLARLP
jgi:tetratricopeptide (TPR) repeat protein